MNTFSHLPQGLSRRSVARGAAWSVPLIAATTSVSAYAASSACIPTISYNGDIRYHWGQRYRRHEGQGRTTQVLQTGAGSVSIYNLPAGVTVSSIVIDIFVQRRQGQHSEGPGVLSPANRAATFSGQTGGFRPQDYRDSWMNKTTDQDQNYNVSDRYPAINSGFDPFVTLSNPPDGIPTQWSDGSVSPGWKLEYQWSARRNRLQNRYTGAPGGCRNFSTGWSGQYNVTYQGMTQVPFEGGTPRAPFARAEVRATLSDGRVLTVTVLA